MELSLNDFAAAVAARAAWWQEAGVQWQLHYGPAHDKSAAWVDCTTAHREAQLTVWTSGEAELDVGDVSTGAITSTHYELSDTAELAVCLDDLTGQLTAPTGGA
ncbi:hypothetical protein AB0M46_31735 [Dactylosporangium sp. NPDC051485]|uniref:hypothetical protein n=1 Tax=Dactylosporangium sp. NPDC051485 TaxID=3154846 RepID=UPI00343AF8CA